MDYNFTGNICFPLQSSVAEMEDRETEVLDAIDAGKKVMEQPSAEMIAVKKKVGDTSNRWKDLKYKLMEKRNKEESNLRQLVKYASTVDELERWVHVASANVMAAAGTTADKEPGDVRLITKQLDQIKVIFENVLTASLFWILSRTENVCRYVKL